MMGSMLSKMTLKQSTYALIARGLIYPQTRSLAIINALAKWQMNQGRDVLHCKLRILSFRSICISQAVYSTVKSLSLVCFFSNWIMVLSFNNKCNFIQTFL